MWFVGLSEKDSERHQRLSERVEVSSKIQSAALDWEGEMQPFTKWNPYSLNHLAVQGVKALRDAHISATRERNQDSKETRQMVAHSVLVFRRNVDPNGKAHYGYMDPKTSRKTSITRGERLSAIFVPFSGKICIYNHDKKDYGMDKFKNQPFNTNDWSFMEPLSILWKESS